MAKTVLIVDDAATIRKLVKFALSKGGYMVIEAEDGVKGLETAQNNPHIDLIISDVNMPHMNGLEMVEKIKADPKISHIPIFMLTTDADGKLALRGKQAGVLAWLVKPFAPEKLLNAVLKILG